jgi:hypothetical protein
MVVICESLRESSVWRVGQFLSPAGCILIRVTATLSVMSDNLSLPSSCSMFGVLLVNSEELDMDMFRIIILLFVIAYLCWWIRGVG